MSFISSRDLKGSSFHPSSPPSERLIIKLANRDANRTRADYAEFFIGQRAKHPVTWKVQEFKDPVKSGSPVAVCVEDVSRLYFDSQVSLIPAVNSPSLGVDHVPALISVCPQSNPYLCKEITLRKHFYLSTLLHHFEGVIC
jgi:hypothetical protein